ncbi:MAG: hypothetical protein EBT02_18150, partial [Planctomycetia bacterium]|nr:hypothetical protein [Planctomycetia bacterium]
PTKPEPEITTEVPTSPEVGVKEVMEGGDKAGTIKLAVVVTVAPGVVTEIGPVVAPVGTLAVIWLAEFTTTVVAVTPLNLT